MRKKILELSSNVMHSFLAGLLLVSTISCNKDLENKIELPLNDSATTIIGKSYKVAYIVVEGAVGSVVGNQATDFNNMPYLASTTTHGLFSWNSIASDYTEDITFYADLLTGVKVGKHHVTSSDLKQSNLDEYPLIVDRLKNNLGIRTAVFTSNQAVHQLLADSEPDVKNVVQTDQQVVAAARAEFSKPETGFTLVTLKDADSAGKAAGYGPDSPEYMAALEKVDNSIKDLVDAIEQRPNYSSEKWLIVVASHRGGDYEIDPFLDDNSLYSIPIRNNFVLFYNKQFQYKIVQKMDLSDPTYDGSAIRYTGSATSASIDAAQAEIYNIGNSTTAGEFTIQLKIKVHTLGSNNPTFLSKMNNTGNSTNGWSFIYSGQTGWRFKVYGTQAVDSEPFKINEWYTLTAKVIDDNGTRKARVYRNGVFKAEATLGSAEGSSTEALKLGYGGAWGSGASHSITDVRFYNTALSDQYIASNYCSTAVYDDDPYWKSLKGYWPAIEGTGDIIADKSDSQRDFNLTGAVAWNSFSERSGSLCPTAPQFLELSTIQSVDAPLMVYNWFGILGIEKYNLDSQLWAPSFSVN